MRYIEQYVREKGVANLLALLLAIGMCAYGDANVPPLVNYQGRLTDAQGTPLTGQHKLVFNIYDVPTAGTAKWGPQEFAAVPVVGGQFNVILGTTDKNGKSIAEAFAAKDRYLGISVDNGTEIAPRQQVLSAPFALEAGRARYEVPVGGVIMWWGVPSSVPEGFEICDGSSPVTPGATLSGMKPDMRDRFAKGLATSGDALGKTSGSNTFPDHTHDLVSGDPVASQGKMLVASGWTSTSLTAFERPRTYTSGINALGSGVDASYANAPAFVSMYFIIRVK